MSRTVPPMRIAPDGSVVARIGPLTSPWVALRGDRYRGQAWRDLSVADWPEFAEDVLRQRRHVSRETPPARTPLHGGPARV